MPGMWTPPAPPVSAGPARDAGEPPAADFADTEPSGTWSEEAEATLEWAETERLGLI